MASHSPSHDSGYGSQTPSPHRRARIPARGPYHRFPPPPPMPTPTLAPGPIDENFAFNAASCLPTTTRPLARAPFHHQPFFHAAAAAASVYWPPPPPPPPPVQAPATPTHTIGPVHTKRPPRIRAPVRPAATIAFAVETPRTVNPVGQYGYLRVGGRNGFREREKVLVDGNGREMWKGGGDG